MGGSVNKVLLVGHVGQDPEIRSFQSGDRVASFSLATSERWKDKASGEMKEKTEWSKVCVFNEHIVDVVEKYVTKGSKLYVEGSLQTRKWEDRDGNERYTTEVVIGKFRGELVLLDSRKSDVAGGNNTVPGGGVRAPRAVGPGGLTPIEGGASKPRWEPSAGGDLEDSIPF